MDQPSENGSKIPATASPATSDDLLAEAFKSVRLPDSVSMLKASNTLMALRGHPMTDFSTIPPDILANALQDTIHKDIGNTRPARLVRAKPKPPPSEQPKA